tara:strand:+ start:275 stop:448 length:174 start_codon:yes stop_codon:yes gene_type:complete
MGAAQFYIRHASGRTRICSDDELAAYKAAGWSQTGSVEVVEAKPAKKKKAAAKKKAD